MWARYYILILSIHSMYGKFNEAAVIAEETKSWIKSIGKVPSNNNSDVILYYNISLVYFGKGDYRSSLIWLNKILNNSKKGQTVIMNAYCSFIIFNLILHYELNNSELLPYITKSTFQFLLKKEKLYKFETIIMQFIRRTLLNFKTDKLQKEAFKKLKAELIPLTENDFEKQAFEFFDFIAWLDSKIEKRSFAEMVKKRNPS